MKKSVFLICIIISLIFTLAFKSYTINNFPLFGKLIVLDPGHGGLDPGSLFKDQYEKDYNLIFAFSLKSELEHLGASVIMTREGDYDLSSPNARYRKKNDFNNRIKLINESKADLYISLHMNYLNDSSYYGAQSFYTKDNEKNKALAESLQENFNKFFNFKKKAKTIDSNKYMYKRLEVDGVLIEYGFISSYKDRTNLKKDTYREDLSKVISATLIEYFT